MISKIEANISKQSFKKSKMLLKLLLSNLLKSKLIIYSISKCIKKIFKTEF